MNTKRSDISILRIIATLAVIFLHTNNTILNNLQNYSLSSTYKFLISTNVSIMNWAVPMFLIITGALLLNKKEISIYLMISKYIKRIIYALFIFGVPFAMIEIYMNTNTIQPTNMLIQSIVKVIDGNSWSHLWYLYALIGIYFILPFIKIVLDNTDKKTHKIILLILFLFNFCKKFIEQIVGISIAFNIPIMTYTVFYIIMGNYLINNEFKLEKNKKRLLILLILETTIVIIINIYSKKALDFLGYDPPIIAIFAITLFLMFKNLKIKESNYLWQMDRLCFCVYLVHPVFINFMYKFIKITPLNIRIIPIGITVFFMIFVIVSFVASFILNKIPFLRKNVL